MRTIIIILAMLTALPSVCFADLTTFVEKIFQNDRTDLTVLEEKLLLRDRQGAHDVLQQMLRQDSDTFYKILDMYDPILGMFETYDKLQNATGFNEQRLIDEFHEYSRLLPLQIPFSNKLVDAINGVRDKVNVRIQKRKEEARLAAEQRKLEQEERERAQVARFEAIRKYREEQRRKDDEARKKAQEEQEALAAEQEQQRLYHEKVATAQEWACAEPDYIKQSLICQVCGSIEGKRQLREGLKRYQSYERKFAVVNPIARLDAVNMDIEYDSQIADGKGQYKSKFRKNFPMSACQKFDADVCQSRLNAIEKQLVQKHLTATN
ncbi:hypothetical protein GEOBRER4_n0517 [Citrifermentans bremense]|uniref:Uncharacterized protein n=1 Tax=Citrifermentans bremense TaxID=60035 RepID=A0A6S6M222_9BACT|nr:hypothetical protein [Citrifermentans bremense]BCG45751.1 hypothetical protein GEOBRER4_n0517 [Citrifermentans bremense]